MLAKPIFTISDRVYNELVRKGDKLFEITITPKQAVIAGTGLIIWAYMSFYVFMSKIYLKLYSRIHDKMVAFTRPAVKLLFKAFLKTPLGKEITSVPGNIQSETVKYVGKLLKSQAIKDAIEDAASKSAISITYITVLGVGFRLLEKIGQYVYKMLKKIGAPHRFIPGLTSALEFALIVTLNPATRIANTISNGLLGFIEKLINLGSSTGFGDFMKELGKTAKSFKTAFKYLGKTRDINVAIFSISPQNIFKQLLNIIRVTGHIESIADTFGDESAQAVKNAFRTARAMSVTALVIMPLAYVAKAFMRKYIWDNPESLFAKLSRNKLLWLLSYIFMSFAIMIYAIMINVLFILIGVSRSNEAVEKLDMLLKVERKSTLARVVRRVDRLFRGSFNEKDVKYLAKLFNLNVDSVSEALDRLKNTLKDM